MPLLASYISDRGTFGRVETSEATQINIYEISPEIGLAEKLSIAASQIPTSDYWYVASEQSTMTADEATMAFLDFVDLLTNEADALLAMEWTEQSVTPVILSDEGVSFTAWRIRYYNYYTSDLIVGFVDDTTGKVINLRASGIPSQMLTLYDESIGDIAALYYGFELSEKNYYSNYATEESAFYYSWSFRFNSPGSLKIKIIVGFDYFLYNNGDYISILNEESRLTEY